LKIKYWSEAFAAPYRNILEGNFKENKNLENLPNEIKIFKAYFPATF